MEGELWKISGSVLKCVTGNQMLRVITMCSTARVSCKRDIFSAICVIVADVVSVSYCKAVQNLPHVGRKQK